MASFKVPCPSCEYQVPIKNESLIGTKVECPKCKYRFKVEEPKGGVPKESAKADKKKVAAGDGKKKSKKTVAIVVGVLAVAVLAAVGIAMMGGDTKKPGPGPGAYKGNPDDGKGNPDGTDPNGAGKGGGTTEPPKKPTAPPSNKEASNLLPGQTVALYRFDVERIRLTPASFLFDRAMLEMFRRSFGFDADQVGVYYHAFVGDTRDPFGVIRLRSPLFEKEVVANMAPTADPKSIKKKWTLYAFKSNPFANAVTNTLSFGSLFGDLYEKLPAGPVKPPAGPRVVGMCMYDSQHVLVGDYARLESFLSGLDAKGDTKFLSATGTPPEGVELAEKAQFLSIDPKMKRVLIGLGAETTAPPPVVYVEKLVQGSYDPKLLKADLQPVTAVLDPLLTHTHYLAASLSSFSTGGVTAAVRLYMTSDAAAFEAVRDHLIPTLPFAALAASVYLNTPVEFRNLTSGGSTPVTPGGDPTQPGTGGDPMRPPGGRPIQPPPGGQPMRPGYGMGSQPPPGTGQPYPPGMEPGGMVTQPIDPNQPQTLAPSHIDLMLTDQVVTLAVELNWSSETYRTKVEPHLVGMANTVKGKMAVFASEESYYRLAAAVPEFQKAARFPAGNRSSKETVHFPRGTAARPRDASRMGLDYPPETRVSLFAEMLPYLGRDSLHKSINRDIAWFEGDNLRAGEAWVPELLVPTYPQSAWRATSRYVSDGRVLGGTNYVGIAGSGLDAARYDPTNPDHAKKVGMTGYDWGSKVDDVKDGLSNTIYLMQTPPGLSQPWIAGGGATLRGLNEADPMRGFAHTYGTPDKKPGTYALMGDGSVRFVPEKIDPKVLLAMSTRAGMEDLADLNTPAPRVDPPKKVVEEPKPIDPKGKVPTPADPKTPAGAVGLAPPPREK